MRPAFSVILFTVLSGAGLGALAWVALLDLGAALVAAGPAMARADSLAAVAAGIALVVIGLCFSTLHLANPRNAWRSLTRWRSSWLSREAALALVLLPVAAAYALAGWQDAAAMRIALAVLLVPLAWAMLFCTAMIYASLKPIRQWHTTRVPVGYLLIGHASGVLVVLACMPVVLAGRSWLVPAAVLLLVVAALAKLEYWRFAGGNERSVTLERALGVAQGVRPPGARSVMAARLLDAGHSRGTFLTREFMADAGAHAHALKAAAIGAGFVLPAFLLLAASGSAAARVGALVACIIGLLAERWLFFAEARHTVRLYHGEKRT